MNDIDRLESDLKELGYNLSDTQSKLENMDERFPHFLVGLKGCVRTHIAIFETHEQLKAFCKNWELRTRSVGKYRKNSPLYGYDRLLIERIFIPNDIPFNPTLKDFEKGK